MNETVSKVRRFLSKSVTENLELKLIAIVITALLFFFVNIQEESERVIDVEVEKTFPAPSSSLVMTGEFPDFVRLRVRGPRSIIKALKPGQIGPVKVDLSRRGGGTSFYTFNPEDFELQSHGLAFVDVTPASVQVKMERQTTKQLPVRVSTYGKLDPSAVLVGEPKVTPQVVTGVGSTSALKRVKAAETEDVDIEGLGAGEHVLVVLLKPIDGVSIREGDETRVTLNVRWILNQRTLSGLPVQARGTDLYAEFSPSAVTVSLAGPKAALDRLDPLAIAPVVVLGDKEAAAPGVYRRGVSVLDLPKEITVVSIAPNRVQVRLSASGQAKPKENSAKIVAP